MKTVDEYEQFVINSLNSILSKKHQRPIYLDANFFEIGLDSLQLASLEFLIRDRFPALNLPNGICYQVSSLRELVHRMYAIQQSRLTPPIAAMRSSTKRRMLQETTSQQQQQQQHNVSGESSIADDLPPLSRAQRQIWFACHVIGKSGNFAEEFAFLLTSKNAVNGERLSTSRLVEALNATVMSNQTLRSVVSGSGDTQTLLSGTEAFFFFSSVDDDKESTMLHLFEEDVISVIDQRGDIPVRFAFVRKSAEEVIFLAKFHAITADGRSIRLFLERFLMAYDVYQHDCRQRRSGSEFFDFVRHEQRMMSDGVFDESVTYWKQKLRGWDYEAEKLPMRADYASPQRDTTTTVGVWNEIVGATEKRVRELADAMRVVAERSGATFFCTVVTMLRLLFYKMYNVRRLMIGIPVECRPSLSSDPNGGDGATGTNFSQTLGVFLNLCVAYESVPDDGDATLVEFVQQNARGMREMLRHSWLPYDEVIAALRRQSRDTERQLNGGEASGVAAIADPELIQVAVIQDTSVDDDLFFGAIHLDHISLKKYGEEVSLRKRGAPLYPLMVHVVEERVAGALRFRIEFNTAHFTADFISTMFEKFTVMCEKIAKAAGSAQLERLSIASISLITRSDVDHHRRFYRENCTDRVPIAVSPISAIFTQLHRLPPSKVVVEDGYGRRLTAEHMLRYVDCLSATLRQALFEAFGANGYGEQSPVALLHQRNADLIMLILASWAIGRPVLPISNDWPPEKVRETLAETLPLDVVLISDREENLGLCRNQICARSLFDKAKQLMERKRDHPPLRPICAAAQTPRKLSAESALLLAPPTQKASVVSTATLSRATAIVTSTTNFLRQRNYRPDLLYLTFTSGSTGRPRVVMTECCGPMNLVHNYTTLFNYNAESVVCQAVSNAFDIFFADLLIALLNGARLLITRDAIPGADELKRATHAYVMPAYVSELQDESQLTLLKDLEVLQFGGEPICGAWLKKALDAGVNAVQLFGFTEHSVYTTYKRFRRESSLKELTEAKMCIGTPFRNTYFFAVDADGQMLPADAIGAEGTLCSAGCGVARGYFLTANGAQLQTQRFRYDSSLCVRYFVTSDRVRVESSGQLRFIGRDDEWSVKVRGNIVHILEVESLLGQYVSQIARCACVAVAGSGSSSAETPVGKLTAFVCAKDRSIGEPKLLQIIYRQLRRRCPLYMIPEVIKIVDRLPLNSNGKIDRQRLKAAAVTATAATKDDGSPTASARQTTDDHSAQVCEIFARFMKIDGLGPDDNLFERGADSIQLLMSIQQIRDRLGVVVDLEGVFRYQTVRRVLHHASLTSGRAADRPDHFDALLRRTEKRIPLSHNQEQIWLTERFHSVESRQTSDVYVIPITFTFNKAPDERGLRDSINRLIQNNAVLRTVVVIAEEHAVASDDEEKDGLVPYQTLLSATESFVLPLNSSAADSSTAFRINLVEEIPLKIFSSSEKNEGGGTVFVTFLLHHFAVDGASLSLIADQLARGYNAEAERSDGITSNIGRRESDAPSNSNTLSYAYAQFSVEQRSTDFQTFLRYWSEELEAVKNAQLPIDFKPSSDKLDVAAAAAKIDAVEAEFALPHPFLRNFITENSCTLTQFLLTAYLKAQSRLNPEDETAVVGIAFENRSTRYRDVIGFFSNVQAVPFSLKNVDTPAMLLRDVREKLLSAGRHASVPFPLVVRELRPRRSECGRNPLFQRTFAVEQTISGEFVDDEAGRLLFGGDVVASADEPRRANDAKFDQCWRLARQKPGGEMRCLPEEEESEYPFKVIVEYNTRFLKRSTIEKHLEAFRHSANWMLGLDRPRIDRPTAPPNTTTLDVIVEQLRQIWRHVLDTSADVGMEENFFEIGGHSLLANRICSLVKQRLHIDCDLFLFFQHQTIAELSAALYERSLSGGGGGRDDEDDHFDDKPGFPDDTFSTLYDSALAESARVPTCRLQDPLLRIYREVNSRAAVAAYTIPVRIRLSADVSLKRLKTCLKALLSLHPILRTRFEEDADGRFYQRVLSIRDPLFERHVFGGQWNDSGVGSPPPLPSEETSDNGCSTLFKPFKVPPLKLWITTENRTLHMEISHLIFDGASVNVLMRDLHQLYYCGTAGVKMDVGAARPVYHDFSARLNAKFDSASDENRRFWCSVVAACPPENRLITSATRTAALSNDSGRRAKTVALRVPNLNRQLGAACRTFRVPPLCVAMFAFGQLLRQRMAFYNADFCVGTVVDVRDAERLHDAIGFFVNTVPIPFRVERLGTATTGEELRNRMIEFNRLIDEAVNRNRLAYDQILDATDRDSLFDVMLVIDNSNSASTIGSVPANNTTDGFRVLECRPTASKFDLTLFVRLEGANGDVHVEFMPSLFVDGDGFPRQLAVEWAAFIQRLSAFETCAEPLCLMRDNVIHGFDGVDRPPVGLFSLIDAQARRTPDRVALQTPGNAFNVSYAELIAILDQLADRLARRHFETTGRTIAADTLIGIIGRRSCVASVLLALAVLRSGGAYLPIDYEIWPTSRVEIILAEANVEFCVRLDEVEETMPLGTVVHESCFLEVADEYLIIIERRGSGEPAAATAKCSTPWTSFGVNDGGHDLAYVIFTSGTTSKPKGVALERRGVVSMIVDAVRRFYVDAIDSVYQFTDFCFDNSVLEIFLALFNGARLFVDDECEWRRGGLDLNSGLQTVSESGEERRLEGEGTKNQPIRTETGKVSAEGAAENRKVELMRANVEQEQARGGENAVTQTKTKTPPLTTATDRLKKTKRRASRYFCVQRFCRHVEEHSITHALLFPALLETFEDAELYAFGRGIRYWISGAEKMSRALMERALGAGVHVVQSYGPTECTCFMLSRRMHFGDHPQNLGRPIGHMAVTVRTPDGDPAIPFTAHQLYVSGVGLTRGYLNRAADQQPFKVFDGVRYYATGDVVQIVDDDEILYVGRTDSQLKIRGFRVDLGEIENVLADLPGVRLAKAAASTAVNGHHIVAYVAADPTATITEDALRQHCRSRLPYYMIPRFFHILNRFPVSSNSKTDFKSLPQPDELIKKASERRGRNTAADKIEESKVDEIMEDNQLLIELEEDSSFQITENSRPFSGDNLPQQKDDPIRTGLSAEAVENVLRTIFDILHISAVDATECKHLSFIQLGGNSLNAQRIINRLNEAERRGDCSLDMGHLLRSEGTVVELAAELAANTMTAEENKPNEEAIGGAAAATDQGERKVDYSLIPLSRQQEQMWYLSHVDTKHLYTLPLVQRFSRAINVQRLHAAFMHIIADHAVLRTVFHESADYDLYQRIMSLTESYYVNVRSDRELPMFCADEMTRFATSALVAFDLRREPPLRCQLFREALAAGGGYVMIALIHHAACDAYSTGLLESELVRFYDRVEKQDESESTSDAKDHRPEVRQRKHANAYALWASEQRSVDVESRMNTKAEEFAAQFTATLEDALPPQLLFHAGDQINNPKAASDSGVISAEFYIPIGKLKAGGVTAFNFICAALLRTISDWALRQPPDIRPMALRIGSTTSNRRTSHVESTIGNFLNNLVMTLPVGAISQNSNSASATFATSLQRVVRSLESAMCFADVPFATLFAALRKRHADTVTRVEQLYSVYVNCRYDLESEKSLAAMPEAVIDRRFTEELVSTLSGGVKELEHFMEVVVDERAMDYSVRISISTEEVNFIRGRPPFSPDRKSVRRFIDAFRRECLVGAHVCEMRVAERVTDAVRKVLFGLADANVLKSLRGTDNFFALGGNSILLLKLRKRLEDALDAEVAVGDLLNRSTIDDFVLFAEGLVGAHLRNGPAVEFESDYSGDDDSDTNWSDCLAIQQHPTPTAGRTKKVSFADETIVQTLVDDLASSDSSSSDDEKPQQHLMIVLFHALIAGNLSYTALCEALKRHHDSSTTSLTVLGVQHPETFRPLPARSYPTDSLRHLAEHYANCLKCYVGSGCRRPPSRIVLIGASLGATLAYECCETLKMHVDVDVLKNFVGMLGIKQRDILLGTTYQSITTIHQETKSYNQIISIDGNAQPMKEWPTRDEHETVMRAAIANRSGSLRHTSSTLTNDGDVVNMVGTVSNASADSIDEQTMTNMIENAWNLLQLRLEHKFSEKFGASSTPTKMVLLRASEEVKGDNSGEYDDYGWHRLNVNLIAVDTIAGSHATMLNAENCDALAQKIFEYC